MTFGNFFYSCLNRDIRGANLLVDSSGVVMLADFGMAKHVRLLSSSLSSLLYRLVFWFLSCIMIFFGCSHSSFWHVVDGISSVFFFFLYIESKTLLNSPLSSWTFGEKISLLHLLVPYFLIKQDYQYLWIIFFKKEDKLMFVCSNAQLWSSLWLWQQHGPYYEKAESVKCNP